MKNEIIGIILAICSIGLCLLLFSTLVPWYAEVSGEAEKAEQARLDAEACKPYKVAEKGETGVLYCQCTESESQKLGRC